MELRNKVALITGAGRGIGRAIALAMAKEGAFVAVNSATSENAQKVVSEISQFGKGIAVPGDVSKEDVVKSVVKKTLDEFGTIDILVNNAGIGRPKPILELQESEWNRIIDVNLKSVFLCSKEVAKIMIEKGAGVIINISSVSGLGGRPNRSAYCASKAGVILLTQCMACEWTKYGIRVNAIAPGPIETDRAQVLDINEREKIRKRTLLNRLGLPEEVAKVAVFLASDKSSYIIGSTIVVDGGWMAYSFV